MKRSVVITGLGMVTPLGNEPSEIISCMSNGKTAACKPCTFDVSPFACPLCAENPDFDAENYFPENKTLRMMNRDAQLAVVAARLAFQDAALTIGIQYAAADIGLFGATGLAGMPIDDVRSLVKNSAGNNGELDLARFGREALKRVRPVLSFKILANMPICFVSMFEGIRGHNAVYTPWEGQGARAIEAGFMAIRNGRTQCALVGGCDTKANVLGFISLEQHGAFQSWRETGRGAIPGDGAAFLVLEDEERALMRGAKIYARLTICSTRTKNTSNPDKSITELMQSFGDMSPSVIMAGSDGYSENQNVELQTITKLAGVTTKIFYPKQHVGNLFAAAGAVQVCLAAAACKTVDVGNVVLANCIGHGSEMGSFALEAV